jgi:hypothetical protein
MEENTAPTTQSQNETAPRLGPDKPIRAFEDILELNLDLIETQRKRVARASAEEARTGCLDKAVSVEIKRLNAMITTYSELLNRPQARAAAQPRTGKGAVTQILASLAPKKHRRRK